MFRTPADVQIDESNDNVLTSNPEHLNQRIVRRGSRAGWYEMTYKFKWATVSPGPLVRFLSQGDYLAIGIKDSGGRIDEGGRAGGRLRSLLGNGPRISRLAGWKSKALKVPNFDTPRLAPWL